ncbi:MAG TPA: aldo/keto reductase [Flavitalea sp.]|nr:aldo/keto reductase [Flavitalea sp.]
MKDKPCSIGLGCVTFGREIDKPASFAMMDHAVELGIKMFDTANAYGRGLSEKIIGEWLASRAGRTPVVIATKLLPPYTPGQIEESIDESLRRLGTDSIDILYMHRWDPSCENVEGLTALGNLQRKGKVNALGASNFSAIQLGRLLKLQSHQGLAQIRFAQNNHNLAVSDLTPEFKAVCAAMSVEIVTYSPLGAGFLTGKHERAVAPGSRFDLMPAHQDVYFQEASFKRLRRLQAIATRTGYTPAHLALAWALHQPVATVLVGGRTPAHLDQAFEALSFKDTHLFAELEGK